MGDCATREFVIQSLLYNRIPKDSVECMTARSCVNKKQPLDMNKNDVNVKEEDTALKGSY